MKTAISLISSLFLGLVLKDLVESRGRILASVVFGCMAFVFFMSAILLASVDLALQYEAQGFFLWNAILGVSAIFAAAGLVFVITAKLVFPKPRLQRSLQALGDTSAITNMFEQFAQGFAAGQAAPEEPARADSPPASRPPSPHQAPVFAPT